MRYLAGLAAATLLAGCSAPQETAPAPTAKPAIEWRLPSAAISRGDAERALEVFLQACPRLGAEAGADVKNIRVETNDEYAEHRLAKGWKTAFTIAIALNDDLTTLPNVVGDGGPLPGETLWFNLGGGSQAGVMAGERAAQALCGLPDGDGSDTFRPLPELSFLGSAG